MPINGAATLKMINPLRRFWNRHLTRGIILMYHRIADVEIDPWGLCVSPAHFAQHLKAFRDYATPQSLSDFVHSYQKGRTARNSVVITFDDGYVDNLRSAKPLLTEYEMPATVFITTGYIDSPREFFWDELSQIILEQDTLPDCLTLVINGQSVEKRLGASARHNEVTRSPDKRTHPFYAEKGTRLSLYFELWRLIQSLPYPKQFDILDQLKAWAGIETQLRDDHRPLTLQELQLLDLDERIEIGAHSVTHPRLSLHSTAIQEREMLGSKQQLETWLNHKIGAFSYPFGDFESETITTALSMGFDCACTSAEGTVLRNTPPMSLPRYTVLDWNGDEMARHLRQWLNIA